MIHQDQGYNHPNSYPNNYQDNYNNFEAYDQPIQDEFDKYEQWRQTQLSMSEAVMTGMYAYSLVDDRSSRSEFWWWYIFLVLALCVTNFLSRLIGMPYLFYIAIFALISPTVCVTLRRMHDVGRSGIWILLALTGVGIIPILYWLLQPSQPGSNDWGEQPNLVRID